MISGWNLDDRYNCKSCGYRIPIAGKRAKHFRYRDIESFYIPVIKSNKDPSVSERLKETVFSRIRTLDQVRSILTLTII